MYVVDLVGLATVLGWGAFAASQARLPPPNSLLLESSVLGSWEQYRCKGCVWYIWDEEGQQKQGARVSNVAIKHLTCPIHSPSPPSPTCRHIRASRHLGDHFCSQCSIFIDKEFEAQYFHALLSLAIFFSLNIANRGKVWTLFKVVSE